MEGKLARFRSRPRCKARPEKRLQARISVIEVQGMERVRKMALITIVSATARVDRVVGQAARAGPARLSGSPDWRSHPLIGRKAEAMPAPAATGTVMSLYTGHPDGLANGSAQFHAGTRDGAATFIRPWLASEMSLRTSRGSLRPAPPTRTHRSFYFTDIRWGFPTPRQYPTNQARR